MSNDNCPECGGTGSVRYAHAPNDYYDCDKCNSTGEIDEPSPWTTEPPTEPGWYGAIRNNNDGSLSEPEPVFIDATIGAVHMFFDPNIYETERFTYWGPRITFPPAPKDPQ